MSFKNILHILIAVCLLSACSKKQTPTPGQQQSTTPVDVYMAGTILASNGHYVAAYWKNGVPVKLGDSSSNSFAYSIAVNGTDIYVAGNNTINGNTVYLYWKNGVATILTTPSNVSVYQSTSAHGIAVSGNDVYVMCYSAVQNGYEKAGYWKNGTLVLLPSTASWATAQSIFINGNDVYVAGQTEPLDIGYATYWKNGVATVLSDTASAANDIIVKGNDVYIAGILNVSAVYWKNGTAHKATSNDGSADALAIAVNGNDVYLAGYTNLITANDAATYWKNGVSTYITPLTPYQTGQNWSSGQAIAINGDDMYITGPFLNYYNCYWENGKFIPLAENANMEYTINGLAIVPH